MCFSKLNLRARGVKKFLDQKYSETPIYDYINIIKGLHDILYWNFDNSNKFPPRMWTRLFSVEIKFLFG